jgi:uncharacterized protein YhfF
MTCEKNMDKEKNAVEVYWQSYLDSVRPDQSPLPLKYEAWSFGNTPDMADHLGSLTRQGIKTATSSLVWVYEAEDEPYPKTGGISIILDGQGNPLCIIETIDVEIQPFNEVDEMYAYEEGEGDRTLEYWRKVHWEFFSEECKSIAREPAENMPVLCERFRIIYT